jgi:serine/threonine-protein kinase
MAMRFVPGGPFLMGTDDPDAPDREKPVGSYPKGASAYDILDLAGNVWEWVADWYDPSYYGTVQPGVLEPMGPLSGSERVTRGGSVGYGSNEARTAYRTSGNPEKARGDGLGFRGAVSGDWLP